MDGLDGRRPSCATSCPETRVLILTGLGAARPSRPARWRRGSAASCSKDAPSDELADAIRRVANGRSASWTPTSSRPRWRSGTNPLTDREAEVLRAAAEGGSTEEIGGRSVPLARHRAQLPLERDRQARRAQPDRRDPDRTRGRLALTHSDPDARRVAEVVRIRVLAPDARADQERAPAPGAQEPVARS